MHLHSCQTCRACWILATLLLASTPACGVLASFLPWNSTGKIEHEVKDNRDVKLEPANPELQRSHACGCDERRDDEDGLVNVKRCDEDPQHLCCSVCDKRCSKNPVYPPGLSTCPNQPRHCFDLKPVGDSPSDGYKCAHCGERCVLQSEAPKPPIPMPIPDCDLSIHCKSKESCKLIGGECCGNCHQGCPPWSDVPATQEE